MKKTTPRIWDPEGAFVGGSLFETAYWAVEVSYRQHTAACFILFLLRECSSLSELTSEEAMDLVIAIKKVEKLISSHPYLHPIRFNYLQLGNTLNHLHIHGVPRYKSNQNFYFAGKQWEDINAHQAVKWVHSNESTKMVMAIRDELLSSN